MTEGTKRLYRSRDNRWLGGVCGGIGQYFDLDPTLIRVLFVIFALIIGSGLLIYLLLWIIIPAEPTGDKTSETSMEKEKPADKPAQEKSEGEADEEAE